MMASDAPLFSREEVLAGMPMKRAQMLAYLIEQRTASLAARWRDLSLAAALEASGFGQSIGAALADERDDWGGDSQLDVLRAFRPAGERAERPSLRELERYAADWSPLVPASPRQRAALARVLGQRYRLSAEGLPGLRAALGLDDEAVQRAYEALFGRPIAELYQAEEPLGTWLGRSLAGLGDWVYRLPPFWAAMVLSITLALPQAILAIPIAGDQVGVPITIVLLVVVGALNVLTMAAIAEAVTRSGAQRYGVAFLGRLGHEYLGDAGAIGVVFAAALTFSLALLAAFVGTANTLASLTGLPAPVFALVQGIILFLLLPRARLSITLLVLLGCLNVGLMLALGVLLAPQVRSGWAERLALPSFDQPVLLHAALQSVVGVTLIGFFGQVAAPQIGRLVLPRDPGGRGFIAGSAASSAVLTALLSLWVLVVNGAIAPDILSGERGSVLGPIAADLGPPGEVLGSLLLLVLLGLTSLRASTILGTLVQERLPIQRRATLLLPRARGRLIARPRDDRPRAPRLGLTYQGPAGDQARLALEVQADGALRRVDATVRDTWELADAPELGPFLRRHGARLTVEVLDHDEEAALLRVSASWPLVYEPRAGVRVTDLLEVSDQDMELARWMVRQGPVSAADLAAHSGLDEAAAELRLRALAEGGLAQLADRSLPARYVVRFAPRAVRLPADLYDRLSGAAVASTASNGRASAALRRGREALSSPFARLLLMSSPLLVILLVAEWLLLVGSASFVAAIALCGVLAIPLLAGTFPMLLLVASRRKGDLAAAGTLAWLGQPLVAGAIYLVFLGAILAHGLFIWTDWAMRLAALADAALMLALTALIWKHGGFAPRATIELRAEGQAPDEAQFSISVGGRPAEVGVRLEYPGGEQRLPGASGRIADFSTLTTATVSLPAPGARELKVWLHWATAAGDSEALPAEVVIRDDVGARRLDAGLAGGPLLVPLSGGACEVRISLPRVGAEQAASG